MSDQVFQKLYSQLNQEQKRAVDAIEGPVMVIAGPGTGKTQILTLRIANILLKTDTEPENILALTFTESGVVSMRKRLSEIIGTPAYSVTITTFHSFCNDIIKRFPEDFPHIIGSVSITEIEQIEIIEELITYLKLSVLRPYGEPLYYVKSILSGINNLKREGISPKEFEEIVQKESQFFELIEDLYYEKGAHKGKMKGKYQDLQKKINKHAELVQIYETYQKKLIEEKYYDYNDMIMEVLEALKKNPNLLLSLQEQYHYILVDEHQDTNNSQNRILELISNFHENPNIFVVGDEKQAIFRFQGASLENFLYFKNIYKNAELVILDQNYRSTQCILDNAHCLIESPKKLQANAKHEDQKIKICSFSNPQVENYFLAKDIKEKIESGIKPSSIAILYRDNRDAFPVASMLEKFGLPITIESDQNILEDSDIKKFILLLKTVANFGEQDYFIEALHTDFLNISPLDIYKLIQGANKNKETVFAIIKDKEKMAALEIEDIYKIKNFFSLISSFKTLSKNINLIELFEKITEESGLVSYLVSKPNSHEKLEKLGSLFDEAKKLIEAHKNYRLEDFLDYLELIENHNILVKKGGGSSAQNKIRLMTAHKSKGQEFDHVYIINAFDGHWGNRRRGESLPLPPQVFALSNNEQIEEDEENADERRLFYVAITRAKKTITLTYSKEGFNKKELLPSQFIQELNPELLEDCDNEDCEKEFIENKQIIFLPKKENSIDLKSKEYIKELFLKNGLSVTALNNYLECPWKYFYSNLVRIPKAPSKFQMYGTAIHATLKDFFDGLREREPNLEFLLSKYSHYLNREPFSESDFNEALEKGNKSLTGYFNTYHNLWIPNVLTEYKISGILLTPEVRLTGNLDKIEILNPQGDVNVVDYKTSKPKSRNAIEGATKSSDGNMKRQLVFYKILLDNVPNKKFNMISGDIDFIEPDDRGNYKKENFSITKDETENLKEIILQVSKEILECEFWDKRCEDKNCEFCALRDMMSTSIPTQPLSPILKS